MIETIPELLHEEEHDRVNISNNLIYGGNVKSHKQGNGRKKSEHDVYRRGPDYQQTITKTTDFNNEDHQIVRQHNCAPTTADCMNCKKKRKLWKDVSVTQKIHHFQKATLSAVVDNLIFHKVQNRNCHKKGKYYHATLLVNNVPIKYIRDSGSLVALIPQRLLTNVSTV